MRTPSVGTSNINNFDFYVQSGPHTPRGTGKMRNISVEEYYIFIISSKVLSSNQDPSDSKFIFSNVCIYILIYISINSRLLFSIILAILQFFILNTYIIGPKTVPSYQTHIIGLKIVWVLLL